MLLAILLALEQLALGPRKRLFSRTSDSGIPYSKLALDSNFPIWKHVARIQGEATITATAIVVDQFLVDYAGTMPAEKTTISEKTM